VVERFKSGPSKFIEKRATGLSDITCSGTTKNYRNKHNPIELDRLPNGDAAQLTRTKLAVEPHRTWSACGLQTIINNEDTRGETLHKLTVAVVPQHDQFSCARCTRIPWCKGKCFSKFAKSCADRRSVLSVAATKCTV
jgi:hypothetical protein